MLSLCKRISRTIRRQHPEPGTSSPSCQAVATKPSADADEDEAGNHLSKLRRYLASQKEPFHINAAVFGKSGTGTKTFLRRLTTGMYYTGFDPTESDRYAKNMLVLDRFCVLALSLCGIAYEPVFANDFIIVTYNVGNRESFEDMQRMFYETVEIRQRRDRPVPWQGGMVIALASDLSGHVDAVSQQLGTDFARSNGLDFLAVSSKTGLGCTNDDATTIAMNLLIQQQKLPVGKSSLAGLSDA